MRVLGFAVTLSTVLAASALAQKDDDQVAHPNLVRSAASYAEVQDEFWRMQSTTFASMEEIDAHMELVAQVDPDQAAQAWVSFAALVALQSPEFVAGVTQAADYYGADAVKGGLRASPQYAGQMAGADAARAAIFDHLIDHGASARAAATQMKGQAYDLQSFSWATTARANKQERLASISNMALVEAEIADDQVMKLVSREITLDGGTAILASATMTNDEAIALLRSTDRPSDRPAKLADRSGEVELGDEFFVGKPQIDGATAVMAAEAQLASAAPLRSEYINSALNNALTLAALHVLDPEIEEDIAQHTPAGISACMRTAQLHLQQCVAASKFVYEDPFCIAEHGLDDAAMCFTEGRYVR